MSAGLRGLVFLLVSVGLTAALVEAALRFAIPPDLVLDPIGEGYWEALVGDRPLPPDADIELDPRLGWRMKRDHEGRVASHDEHGFRRTPAPPLGAAGPRVFAVGDSFTYGLGVHDDETFAARLVAELGAEVTNAGVNGFGVDQAVLMWELEGRPRSPDAVLLGYFTDDFHRSALARREVPKACLVPESSGPGLRYEAPGECTPAEGLGTFRLDDALRYAVRRASDRLGRLPVERLERRLERSDRLLERLRDGTRESGARLLVLLIPHCAYPHDGHYGEWIAPKVLASAARLDIPTIDFRDLADRALYAGCHWNAEGHARAAQRIAAELRPLLDEPPRRSGD